MNRREFLGTGFAAAAGGLVADPAEAVDSGNPVASAAGASIVNSHSPNIGIRAYLAREAARITEKALSQFPDKAAWERQIPEKRRQFRAMMGLDSAPFADPRPPVPVHVTGVVERPAYRIEKLHYESLPGLHVTANLYIPKQPLYNRATSEDPLALLRPLRQRESILGPTSPGVVDKGLGAGSRTPAVLYVCGHAQNQKVHYQAHARRLAELGFVCLIAETVELGEAAGNHHGCYREGWFHWYSRGYSPAAVELWNGIRGLDLLAARPDVDADHLGVTGISGGGASTWWIAAGDERIKAAAPCCGTATLESHIYDRVIDGHCDCMWWTNHLGWDLADVGALIAPRPLLIASADRDGIFPIESIRRVHRQLAGLYRKLGRAADLKLVETPGGHSYHEKSRTAIFSWFLKHLAGKEVSPSQVGDLDESPAKQESLDTLRVFVNGMPQPNRTVTIHDEFVVLAKPPQIANAAAVGEERSRVIKALHDITFAQFPKSPPPLDIQEEFALDGDVGYRFAFTSEEGWRLHGTVSGLVKRSSDSGDKLPVLVALRGPREERNAAEGFAGRIRGNWARVIVEPRGTGDTAWGEELEWHLRRAAAWTGRSIASMRVWDTLRALQAVRVLSRVDGTRIALAAHGDMCAVALYAALLDGNVQKLLLESPPATQEAASQPNGKGPAIEMLACLKVTDLPQVAGLLYPAEIVVAGDCPASYAWAEQLYARLGGAGKFRKIANLTD